MESTGLFPVAYVGQIPNPKAYGCFALMTQDEGTRLAGHIYGYEGNGVWTRFGGAIRGVMACTEATILVAADSGKLITLGTAGGFDVKLPAPAAGLNFTIAVKVAPTTAYTITTNGTTQNVIHGQTITRQDAGGNGDSTGGTAVDVITFVANKALIGDHVELICDGTLWYAKAFATAFDGITFD
jgi:hypothetical protein